MPMELQGSPVNLGRIEEMLKELVRQACVSCAPRGTPHGAEAVFEQF